MTILLRLLIILLSSYHFNLLRRYFLRIRTWHIVAVLLIVATFLLYRPAPAIIPKVTLESYPEGISLAEPCPGPALSTQKERCIVVYMAPWCPVCEASIPFLQALVKHLAGDTSTGLAITLGNDELENLIASAKKIGSSVRLDVNDEFLQAAAVSSFPTWILLDKEQRVLNRFSGGAPAGDSFSEDDVRGFLRRF